MSILNQPFHSAHEGCFGCCTESSNPFSTSSYAPDQNNKHRLTGEDQQKKEEIDTLLSDAFKTLTFEERQIQQEELHGVADAIVEESSFIESSLRELEFQINQTKSGRVYETAELRNTGYVHARSLRLSFLRAERYNAKAAADKLLRFFDEKEKLFGTEKLTKDITIDDLDDDDIDALEGGGVQWAGKDRSNRPILLQVPGLRKFRNLKNELKARYFLMMEGIKSPEAQKRGIILICYTVGDCRDCREGEGFLEHFRLIEAIPFFSAAFHFTCDDIKQHLLGSAAMTIMPAGLRSRFRMHLGAHLECLYRLSTYGIPIGLLPLSPESNSLYLEPHLRWCQQYTANHGTKNQSIPARKSLPSPSVGLITEPNPNDVLSSGSIKSDNLGNDRLRVLVKESVEAYRLGSAEEKRHIVDRIISEIHSSGGRFLKKKKGEATWTELPLSQVREKVSQRFRNHNRRRKSASQQEREGIVIADTPLPNDVIFGRKQRNNGTALLHHLISEKSEEYAAANRSAKVLVVDKIIERIQSEEGRFLTASTSDIGRFVELSSIDSIRDRISTYFRNYRRTTKNTATIIGQ